MKEQLNALQRRFPDSPRVEILKGLQLEAEGEYLGAQKAYSKLLSIDETNIVRLSLSRRIPPRDSRVPFAGELVLIAF